MTKASWFSTPYGRNSVLVSGFLQEEQRDKVLSLVTPIKCNRKSSRGVVGTEKNLKSMWAVVRINAEANNLPASQKWLVIWFLQQTLFL